MQTILTRQHLGNILTMIYIQLFGMRRMMTKQISRCSLPVLTVQSKMLMPKWCLFKGDSV